MTFIKVWIGYALFGTALFSLVFAWAVRARQFSNLDHGRYIPLGDEQVQDERGRAAERPRPAEKWGIRAVLIAAAAVVLAVLVVAMRNA